MDYVRVAVAAVVCYLLGCINAAYIYSTKFKHTDIRQYGSGNAGSTNVLRVFGIKAAALVFAADALKGVASVMIARYLCSSTPIALIICTLFVVIGHNWPIFLSYRGGKGVATTIGACLALEPPLALCALGCGIIIVAISKMVSLGSVCGVALLAIGSFVFKYPIEYSLAFSVLSLMCIFQHRGNIKRIFNGTENKLSFKSKKDKAE